MHKEILQQFLEGKLNAEQIQNELDENSIEKDFIDSYQQIISKNNTEVPDFNAFEKIELAKTKRISFIKRLLPYAATALLLISSFLGYQNYQSQQNRLVLTKQEITEIQEETELALLQFSKELNACYAEVSKTKETYRENLKKVSFNKIEIEFNNPIKNLKIN
jgi:hypothetical protein